MDFFFPFVFGKIFLVDGFNYVLGWISSHDLRVSSEDDVPIAHHLEWCTICMRSLEDKGFLEEGMFRDLAFPLVQRTRGNNDQRRSAFCRDVLLCRRIGCHACKYFKSLAQS